MTGAATFAAPTTRRQSWRWMWRDGITVVRRDLAHMRYEPSELLAQVLVPLLLVIVFGYVFGGAIRVPGNGSYREFLMPGLFAMMQVTAIAGTAVAIADDAARGVMDRFRSMPMARSAVVFGQTGANLATGLLNLAVMVVCGLAVGWRAHNGALDTAAALGLLLLVRYAMGWAGVYLGLLVRSPATADALVPLTFPVTMVANTFVPTSGMPGWLQTIADWNPVSCLVAACRQLFGNPGYGNDVAAWPLQHPVLATLAWCAAMLAVFVPLATRRYQRGRT